MTRWLVLSLAFTVGGCAVGSVAGPEDSTEESGPAVRTPARAEAVQPATPTTDPQEIPGIQTGVAEGSFDFGSGGPALSTKVLIPTPTPGGPVPK